MPVTSLPPVAGEQANYDVAFNLLKEGRYPQAADAFSRFLQQYPSSRLAPNAQYWLAESQYVARNYDASMIEFKKVVAQYPGNPKVPLCHAESATSIAKNSNGPRPRRGS